MMASGSKVLLVNLLANQESSSICCANTEKKRVVDDIVLSKVRRIELVNTSARQYSTFVMVFDNLSEADEFIKWIRGLDGVKSVSMGVMKALIVVQDWLREEILKRAR